MCHTCRVCETPVVRENEKKPWPHKCQECKKKAAREYQQSYRLRTRPRINWGELVCGKCGVGTCSVPRRGRPSKWCRQCIRSVKTHQERARKERSKAAGSDKIHEHQCRQCGKRFTSSRKRQLCCSRECSHASGRVRFQRPCDNQSCGRIYWVTPLALSRGKTCCCRACRIEQKFGPTPVCQNPACGKPAKRSSSREIELGRRHGKYCSKRCCYDHRWGATRPGRESSTEQLARASKKALATSLRRKCKLLGVPFDPACTRQAVLDRDGWKCQKCGVRCNKTYKIDKATRRIHARNAEHDHIIPLTCKGTPGNVFENSQCLCRKCNGRKRDTPWGQLRLPLEGAPWENEVQNHNRRNLRSCGGIPVVAG